MHFKIQKLFSILMPIFISFLSHGCGARVSSLDIGDTPPMISKSVLSAGASRTQIVVLNNTSRTIESFKIDPFTHLATVSSSDRLVMPSVAGASNGAYFVSLAGNSYAVIKNDGTEFLNPITIEGEIQSLAFDPRVHALAITSSMQTLTLITLSESGDLTGSFVARDIVDAGKALGASAILSDGRLVVVGGDTQLIVLDIAACVREQSIAKTVLSVESASSMGWIHSIPQVSNMALILDGSRLIVVDVTAGSILDSKSLADSTILGRFVAYDPHIITQNAGQEAQDVIEVSFVSSEGKIVTRALRGSPYALSDSWLDSSSMKLATLFVPPKLSNIFGTKEMQNKPKSEIYRYDLADASKQIRLDKSEVDSDARVILMPDYFFVQLKSVFGRSERRTYGEQAVTETIKGYNLEIMRGRFRKL